MDINTGGMISKMRCHTVAHFTTFHKGEKVQFSAVFKKGDNFCDFMFVPMETETFPERGL